MSSISVDNYPSLSTSKNEGYLSLSSKPDLVSLKVQEAPFPFMFTILDISKNEGYPSFETLISLPDSLIQKAPFPKMLPSIEDNIAERYPSLRLEGQYWGAFSYSSVTEVKIPRSVMYICDYAFWNSEIKSVKINRHCIYFRHSFPEECQIEFYEE